MKRRCSGAPRATYRWALTLFPTNAYASEAEMSLADFEDFYYGACLATDDDPVGAWTRASEETQAPRRVDRGPRARCTSPATGTDLQLGIAGRTFIAADGEHNMPDGEFFTGPVEDSAEGEVTLPPARHLSAGREVAGVRFRFEAGKVVDATAEKGEEFLIEMLDTDEGARRLGELGIGTNYGIDRRHRRDPARREDRRHGPPGRRALSYPETGGVNESRRSTGT